MRLMRFSRLLTLAALQYLFALPCLLAQPHWENLNPGAGGAVQSVVLSPHAAGRAFVLSDVDGLYETTDSGRTWHHVRRYLASTDLSSLRFDPAAPERVYLGTAVGLHVSNDGGATWRLHAGVSRAAYPDIDTNSNPSEPGFGRWQLRIGSIAVHPDDPQIVVAGLGSHRFSFVRQATIFRSADGGESFERVSFGPDDGLNRSIVQLAHASHSGQLYAATREGGLWASSEFGAPGSWESIGPPAGVGPRVDAVAVSPDGAWLFAAYAIPGKTGNRVYARAAAGAEWRVLDQEGFPPDERLDFRNLVPDPRSREDRIKLLSAPQNDRQGLWELDVRIVDGEPIAAWRRIFWFNTRDTAGFDAGWEGGIWGNRPRPLTYAYAPESWESREIWVSGDQTLFRADAPWPDGETGIAPLEWRAVYTSEPVSVFDPSPIQVAFTNPTIVTPPAIRTYSSAGWQSTVDLDLCQAGPVVISSKADHSVVASWDGGASWEDVSSPRRAKSQACAMVPLSGGTVLALAHFSDPFDFGAAGRAGELWAAEVDPNLPRPVRWYFLAGGDGARYGVAAGLPSDRITALVPDRQNPKRVWIATLLNGIFVIADIEALYRAKVAGQAPPPVEAVAGSRVGAGQLNERETVLAQDPALPERLLAASRRRLMAGALSPGASSWTVLAESSREIDFAVSNGPAGPRIFANLVSSDGEGISVSTDGGLTWSRLVLLPDLIALRQPDFDFSSAPPFIAAVEAIRGRVVVAVQNGAPDNLGYGIFSLLLDSAESSVQEITDITGDLPFPKSFRLKADRDPLTGEDRLLLSSWGAGSWRLALDSLFP